MKELQKRAVIIGAGPAGLTAGLEFLRRTGIKPILLEASLEIGGISRTVRYKGNRMDIGGHRFFSKSDRVMQWWMDLMPPLQSAEDSEDQDRDHTITYQGKTRSTRLTTSVSTGGDDKNPSDELRTNLSGLNESGRDSDLVMLIRERRSRIYYLRRFFDYPITLTRATLQNLGAARVVKVGASYMASRLKQIKPEKSLEDFLVNRFGRELYVTFFKSYTEKVWGTPCEQISAEWGAQRIKGLSLLTAVKHFLKKTFIKSKKDLSQKNTDTSLIERFMYPKFGPGQLWEHVAKLITDGVTGINGFRSGEIHLGWKVSAVHCNGDQILSVEATNESGEKQIFAGDYFLSTMPMRELIDAMDAPIPENVKEVSDGLQYRDFITVGLLVDRLKVEEPGGGLLKDTWIYVQEPDVLLGRLQIFNNWSPYLVADPDKIWIGLEYFCYDTDEIWKKDDEEIKALAVAEVVKIGILNPGPVLDAHVVRVPKTYPAYFGTYDRFGELRAFTDSFENLFLIGRNGMHKYNNQDHSMLTAMAVVDGLAAGRVDREALWQINTEQEYHEEK